MVDDLVFTQYELIELFGILLSRRQQIRRVPKAMVQPDIDLLSISVIKKQKRDMIEY